MPLREYRFDAVRRYRLDFAYPDLKLGIELHGATYRNGRHTTGKGFAADRAKMNLAIEQGWRVLEFDGKAVRSGRAIRTLERMLK